MRAKRMVQLRNHPLSCGEKRLIKQSEAALTVDIVSLSGYGTKGWWIAPENYFKLLPTIASIALLTYISPVPP